MAPRYLQEDTYPPSPFCWRGPSISQKLRLAASSSPHCWTVYTVPDSLCTEHTDQLGPVPAHMGQLLVVLPVRNPTRTKSLKKPQQWGYEKVREQRYPRLLHLQQRQGKVATHPGKGQQCRKTQPRYRRGCSFCHLHISPLSQHVHRCPCPCLLTAMTTPEGWKQRSRVKNSNERHWCLGSLQGHHGLRAS